MKELKNNTKKDKTMNTKEKIEIMLACLDEKKIQYKSKSETTWLEWNSSKEPSWDWSQNEYRIKPKKEEKVPHWKYIYLNKDKLSY